MNSVITLDRIENHLGQLEQIFERGRHRSVLRRRLRAIERQGQMDGRLPGVGRGWTTDRRPVRGWFEREGLLPRLAGQLEQAAPRAGR